MELRTQKKSKRSSIWQTISKYVNDFCQSTTLHGYKYLSNDDSIVAKIFWGVTIFVAFSLVITFLIINTKAFMDAAVVTYIESETAPLNVSTKLAPIKVTLD